jgi:hypothetical protein
MNIIVWSGLGVKRISRFDPPAQDDAATHFRLMGNLPAISGKQLIKLLTSDASVAFTMDCHSHIISGMPA